MKFFLLMAFLIAYTYALPADPLGGLGGMVGGVPGLGDGLGKAEGALSNPAALTGALPGGDQLAVLKAAPGADALKGLPTDKLGDVTGKSGLGGLTGGLPGGLPAGLPAGLPSGLPGGLGR